MTKEKFEEKVKLLELVSSWAESESNRTWKRNSFILAINTVLITAFTLLTKPYNFIAISFGSAFGLVLSIIWIKIIPLSRYYESRWHLDMERIIKSDDLIKTYIRGRSKKQNRKRPSKWSSTKYIKIIPISLIIVWSLLLLMSIIMLLKSILLGA